jgi:hypothetical protein
MPVATVSSTDYSQFVGTWSGYQHIASCTSTGDLCRPIGFLYGFTVAITDEAGVKRAHFESSTPSKYSSDLIGAVTDDGGLLFTPAASSTPLTSPAVTVTSLRLSVGASGLSGTLVYTLLTGATKLNPGQILTIRSEIPSASKSGPPPPTVGTLADFVGTWTGAGVYESCHNPTGFGCGGLFPRPVAYDITIQPSGSGLEAVLDPGVPLWPIMRLQGTPQPDGSVRFAGNATGAMASSTVVRADVTLLQLWFDPNAGLVGEFDGTLTRINGADVQHVRIVNGQRASVA